MPKGDPLTLIAAIGLIFWGCLLVGIFYFISMAGNGWNVICLIFPLLMVIAGVATIYEQRKKAQQDSG